METTKQTSRISSMDVMRGVVMVLMAIDHVRVYAGIPAGGPDPAIFFTRWVTHFCAPAFAFFAGTSAYLYGRKNGAVATFLLSRGLLLVILELTVIRFFWTFNFNYANFTLAGVIWMLGWCMVLLAGLVRLPAGAVGAIGLIVIFCQQLFRYPPRVLPHALRQVWEFIYPGGTEPWSGISILYVLVPWVGVMAAGYGFGVIMTRDADQRRRLCLGIGIGATVLFLVIGILTLAPPKPYGLPALLRLLNQQKYPASQLFLLMTLGPTIALLPLAEKARGWFGGILATFGRVPMFYYLLHILLIHVAALIVNFIREGNAQPQWYATYATAPFTFLPPEHRWTLPLLYLVWAIVVVILYFLCSWYAEVKARGRMPWLRYL